MQRQEPSRLDPLANPQQHAKATHVEAYNPDFVFSPSTLEVSAISWSDLKAFLSGPGHIFDAILLQETHKTDKSEFQSIGWQVVGTATKTKADGVMTLIHPKYPSVAW